MERLWRRFLLDESGQGLVEYVLIIALVAIGLIVIMLVFRNSTGNVFLNVRNTLSNAPASQMST